MSFKQISKIRYIYNGFLSPHTQRMRFVLDLDAVYYNHKPHNKNRLAQNPIILGRIARKPTPQEQPFPPGPKAYAVTRGRGPRQRYARPRYTTSDAHSPSQPLPPTSPQPDCSAEPGCSVASAQASPRLDCSPHPVHCSVAALHVPLPSAAGSYLVPPPEEGPDSGSARQTS